MSTLLIVVIIRAPDDTEAVIRWYTPSLAVPKKSKKVWKGTPIKLSLSVSGTDSRRQYLPSIQQCAHVNMIKELQRQVVEFNKVYSLVSNLLPVYNMLKDLEVSMLKILAHTVCNTTICSVNTNQCLLGDRVHS